MRKGHDFAADIERGRERLGQIRGILDSVYHDWDGKDTAGRWTMIVCALGEIRRLATGSITRPHKSIDFFSQTTTTTNKGN